MFDLRTLRLEVGDEHRARINVRVEPFTVGHETYTPTAEGLPAELRITRLRSGLLFSLRFEVTLHGPCHRCLEDAEVTLAIESEEYQDNHPEPGAEDDMTCEYLADQVLDTDRWATDATVLAMPPKVLCSEDCLGLCPACGSNLNEGPCGHDEIAGDPRWEQLRRLQ
jgi:uncharacterized protein